MSDRSRPRGQCEEGRWSRRDALRHASALLLAAFGRSARAESAPTTVRFAETPFKLGVASGDPVADGFVLWTRLAPFPFEPEAVDPVPIQVQWRVASDETMKRIVASGVAIASPELAHSVHVEVAQLQPRSNYFYQFFCGGYDSPVGRTRTTPLSGSAMQSARFALASCQSFSEGYFAAYRDMAEHDLDFVLHVGDYIYESPYDAAVRRIPVPEARDLPGYRALHAQYKLDPDLRNAHARAPWFMIWDDHEVENDWGPDYTPGTPAGEWKARKAAAFQAYYEHMPLRVSSRPGRSETRLYGRAVLGDLLEINLLDDRQYRDLPACLDKGREARRWVSPATCPAILDKTRTILGAPQEKWLLRGLGSQRCRWTVLAQQTVFAPLDMLEDEGLQLNQDGWDAYFASRQRILDVVRDRSLSNVVCLGGDIHTFYAGHVTAEPLNAVSKPLLTEIVTTSISAGGGGEERYQAGQRLLRQQPFATYWDNRWRGYVLNEVTQKEWQAELRIVNDVRVPTSPVARLETLAIEAGRVGISRK